MILLQQTAKKYLPLLLILVFSGIAWSMGLHHYLTFDALKTHQQAFDHFIQEHYFWALLIYLSSYTIIVALSIPGATFMTLAGGIFLGQMIGTVCAVSAATLGAMLLFLSLKSASQDILSQKTGQWAQNMQTGFQKNAWSYLLTLRLVPLFPFVAVNLAAALFQVPFRTFVLTTFLGIIPGTFVYVSLGVALRTVLQQPTLSGSVILDPKILVALTGLGLLSLLPALYKHFKH